MAEEGGGEVAGGAVYENSRTQENAFVDFVVKGFGDEVVACGVVVGPAFFRNLGGGGGFDFVEVEEGVEGWGTESRF